MDAIIFMCSRGKSTLSPVHCMIIAFLPGRYIAPEGIHVCTPTTTEKNNRSNHGEKKKAKLVNIIGKL